MLNIKSFEVNVSFPNQISHVSRILADFLRMPDEFWEIYFGQQGGVADRVGSIDLDSILT